MSIFKRQRRTELLAEETEDALQDEYYPRLEDRTNRVTVPEFLEAFSEAQNTPDLLTVSGRVRAKRVAGKGLVFLDIVNEFQQLQVIVNKSQCDLDPAHRNNRFTMFTKLIEVGDHISATGIAVKSKTGQPSLDVRELPLLVSPTMEQIPEQLNDPKTKMQERHLDLLVNRTPVDVLRLRSAITKYMRDHLHSQRFLEFQTPILAENAGGAVARPFVTKATEFKDKSLALRIAPELWLKRLVIGGIDRVFEIGPAFRNEGVDATHNPEFTMCEFYSAYSNLNDLIKQTEELLCGMASHTQELISTELKSLPAVDMQFFSRPFKQIEFVPALEQALGLRLPKLTSENALPEVLAILKLAGVSIPGEVPDTLPKLLDRLAAMYIEPLSFEEPIFITNHPVCMSPLAKSYVCPQTFQLVSARAELFIGGRELANMYEEENNPEVQKQKLLDHRNMVNKENGEIAIEPQPENEEAEEAEEPLDENENENDEDCAPLDQSFVKALDYALPPTGGWGCGVERLVMLFSGASRISDCLSFGTLRNVVGLSSEETSKQGIATENVAESSEKETSQ